MKLPNGKDIIVEEGAALPSGEPTSSPASLWKSSARSDSILTTPSARVRPSRRLKEQDADGIDAELIFATEARNTAIKDKDTFLGILRGFNDYFIEEYCGVAPDRLVGVAVLPNIGVQEDIAEMKRCKEKGFKAVRLAHVPERQRLSDP